MSFTAQIKQEICEQKLGQIEEITELSAIIRGSYYDENIIKITTENYFLAKHVLNLIKKQENQEPKIIVRKGYNYNKNYIYILELKSKKILNDLSIYKNNKKISLPENYILDDRELEKAYIKGLFLISGSINDPKKSRYHLEFLVEEEKYAEFISNLLNKYYLNSKIIKRENKYMIYIKEAEKIGDFLRIIGASKAVMYYEDIRIYRDHLNMTNRLNNCEQANVDRVISTSLDQVKDIELIEEKLGLETLNEKEKIAAIYRLKYKESSLQELSEIISIETEHSITKSGLHHRFKKIKQIAQNLREK